MDTEFNNSEISRTLDNIDTLIHQGTLTISPDRDHRSSSYGEESFYPQNSPYSSDNDSPEDYPMSNILYTDSRSTGDVLDPFSNVSAFQKQISIRAWIITVIFLVIILLSLPTSIPTPNDNDNNPLNMEPGTVLWSSCNFVTSNDITCLRGRQVNSVSKPHLFYLSRNGEDIVFIESILVSISGSGSAGNLEQNTFLVAHSQFKSTQETLGIPRLYLGNGNGNKNTRDIPDPKITVTNGEIQGSTFDEHEIQQTHFEFPLFSSESKINRFSLIAHVNSFGIGISISDSLYSDNVEKFKNFTLEISVTFSPRGSFADVSGDPYQSSFVSSKNQKTGLPLKTMYSLLSPSTNEILSPNLLFYTTESLKGIRHTVPDCKESPIVSKKSKLDTFTDVEQNESDSDTDKNVDGATINIVPKCRKPETNRINSERLRTGPLLSKRIPRSMSISYSMDYSFSNLKFIYSQKNTFVAHFTGTPQPSTFAYNSNSNPNSGGTLSSSPMIFGNSPFLNFIFSLHTWELLDSIPKHYASYFQNTSTGSHIDIKLSSGFSGLSNSSVVQNQLKKYGLTHIVLDSNLDSSSSQIDPTVPHFVSVNCSTLGNIIHSPDIATKFSSLVLNNSSPNILLDCPLGMCPFELSALSKKISLSPNLLFASLQDDYEFASTGTTLLNYKSHGSSRFSESSNETNVPFLYDYIFQYAASPHIFKFTPYHLLSVSDRENRTFEFNLALPLLISSPIQHFGDISVLAAAIDSDPRYSVWKNIPSSWSNSRYLKYDPGEILTLARYIYHDSGVAKPKTPSKPTDIISKVGHHLHHTDTTVYFAIFNGPTPKEYTLPWNVLVDFDPDEAEHLVFQVCRISKYETDFKKVPGQITPVSTSTTMQLGPFEAIFFVATTIPSTQDAFC